MKYCARPFKEFEIDVDGRCYCCCRWWNKSYCIGNIFEQTPEEIWNGKAAQELRRSIIDGDYKYCNTSECIKMYSDNLNYSLVTDYPEEISLCYDYTCTAKCVFCNDEIKKMPEDKCKQWDDLIDSKLIPLFKNARYVRLSMVGELFVSEHSKKLVKKIAEKYPNVRFEIVSNGIFCSKENIEKLGITDKIATVKFSLPSLNEKTYKKMVRNGDLKKVKENIKYISELYYKKKVSEFLFNFIVSSVNYKEIVSYAKYVGSYGGKVDYILLNQKDSSTDFLRDFDKYNVANPKHPKYNDFINIINSNHFRICKNICINENIQKMKKVSFVEYLKNCLEFYKKYKSL